MPRLQFGVSKHCHTPLELDTDAEFPAPLMPTCCVKDKLEWAKFVLRAAQPFLIHPLDTPHAGHLDVGFDAVEGLLDEAIAAV